MKYRSELDGLRAFSVIAVILFHAKASFATGGYIGVDVFFVLSGYLISSILYSDLQRGQFSIRRFYERRVRRILPVLLVITGLTLILAPYVLPLSETIEVYESGAATALFLANFRFMRKTGYFETAAEDRPLLHMWSLSVEEQFYIVFPLLLFFLYRWCRGGIGFVFLGAAVGSLVLAELGWRQNPTANFFLPFTRAWELLAGALITWHFSRKSAEIRTVSRARGTLALVGLAMVLVPMVWFDRYTPSPSVWVLIPVIGAALVILYAHAGTLAARILGWRYIAGIGLISYSAYLLHQPILAYARALLPPEIRTIPLMISLGLMSLPLGYVSWRFVEQPARYRMRTRPLVGITVAGSVFIAALGIGANLYQASIEMIYLATLGDEQARQRFALLQEASNNRSVSFERDCRWTTYSIDSEFDRRFRECATRHGKAVLVLGDSHAEDLMGMLSSASAHPFIVTFARARCRPHRRLAGSPLYECHYDAAADFLAHERSHVELVAYTQPFFTLFDRYRDTTSTEGFHPELVVEVAEYLERVAQYSPVVMFGPRSTLGFTVLRLNPRRSFAEQLREFYPKGLRAAENLADEAFRRALEGRGVGYLSLIKFLEQDLPENALVDGKLIFHDGDHLSAFGEEQMGAKLMYGLASANSPAANLVYSILSRQ